MYDCRFIILAKFWTCFCGVLCFFFVMPQMQLTLFAQFSGVAGQAEAGEGVDSIQTGGSIQARVGVALVDICSGTKHRLTFIPPHSSVTMRSIWFKREECALMGLMYVNLFRSAARCIQVHTRRCLVVLFCSRSLHSYTHWRSMAGDLHKTHDALKLQRRFVIISPMSHV